MSSRPFPPTQSAHEQDDLEELFLVEQKPDSLELWIRAICGATFGAMIGTWLWVQEWTQGVGPTLTGYFASISVSAYLAAKYGDRYWEGLSKFVRRLLVVGSP